MRVQERDLKRGEGLQRGKKDQDGQEDRPQENLHTETERLKEIGGEIEYGRRR